MNIYIYIYRNHHIHQVMQLALILLTFYLFKLAICLKGLLNGT